MVIHRLKHTIWRMYCNRQSPPTAIPGQVIPLSKSYNPAKLIATSSSSSCSSSTNVSNRPINQQEFQMSILLVAHESRIFLAFFEKNNSPFPLGLIDNGAFDRLTLRGVIFLGVMLGVLLGLLAGARSIEISRKLPLSRGSLRMGSYLIS